MKAASGPPAFPAFTGQPLSSAPTCHTISARVAKTAVDKIRDERTFRSMECILFLNRKNARLTSIEKWRKSTKTFRDRRIFSTARHRDVTQNAVKPRVSRPSNSQKARPVGIFLLILVFAVVIGG